MADDQKYSLLRYPLNSCPDFLKVCIANYPVYKCTISCRKSSWQRDYWIENLCKDSI